MTPRSKAYFRTKNTIKLLMKNGIAVAYEHTSGVILCIPFGNLSEILVPPPHGYSGEIKTTP